MTSLVKRELTSSKGIKHVWEGIGWYNHDRQMIIVSNGYEKKIIKLEDFMKAETMSDLNKNEYKKVPVFIIKANNIIYSIKN